MSLVLWIVCLAMPTEIDVYRQWLGITETARPLNHYQLLRLTAFEDDAAKIRSHYRKMNEHVRKFASGDYAHQSQELLNELARAMLCLTDARRKGEYDASLGRRDDGGARRRTLEELLVGRKVITAEHLAKARSYASAVGLEIRDALVQQKLAQPEVVMQVYAESLGLPYVDLGDIGVDETLLGRVPAVMARQHSCAPVMVDEGQLLVASPNPLGHEVEDQLRLRLGMPVRTVLCTASQINDVVAKHYPKSAAAAEIAASSAAPAASSPAAANQSDAATTDTRTPAEKKRQRLMIAFMSFNFSFMAMMLYQLRLLPVAPSGRPAGFFYSLGVSLLVGGAVSGMAFAFQVMRGK